MFIPELTTRVTVEMDLSGLDEVLEVIASDEILSDIPSLTGMVEEKRDKLKSLKEPLTEAVAKRLQSNQEMIISSKHGPPRSEGMMAECVDLFHDGEDILIGNTASSVDNFPYPLAIEKGSTSHWIEPKTFSALHWTDTDGEHFSKGHMVSGIKADPFVQPSIDDTMKDIDDIWEEFDI